MTTSTLITERPKLGEYDPYYDRYISLILGNDLFGTLEKQLAKTVALFSSRSEAESDFRYAPGKWSLKEVLGHMNDTERIMAYRAMRIARGDRTPIEGFEQDDYVAAANSNRRSTTELLVELKSVRGATRTLLESLTTADSQRSGVANGNSISVRALAYVIAGHAQHHLELLRKQLAG